MVEIGYALSSEEHRPNGLLAHARRAEQVGFSYAMISDHFHPWIDRQGNSPFAWSVLGGVAAQTGHLRLGTGVTCPTMRYQPAIIAQAAATVASMMPGRFMLGLGTGEALNEHVTGGPWPPYAVRRDMLAEAIAIIRGLWRGRMFSHHGCHFTVEDARVYTLPEELPPILVAAAGPRSAWLAAQLGDGLINSTPDADVVKAFRAAGGEGRPCYVQYSVCWAADEMSARRTALAYVPTVGLPGELGQQLATPKQYKQAVQLVTEDRIAQAVVCGPDPEKHAAGIRRCIDAGYDHIHVDQVGPDQEGFFNFYEREVLPRVR